ncbi:MAG: metallophosphoesterase [Bacteroidales bacterium]
MSFLISAKYLFIVTALFLGACTGSDTHEDATVDSIIDDVITELYQTKGEQELASLTHGQVMDLFSDDELQLLGTRHWMFDVNVPVVVSVMRSSDQDIVPFWLTGRDFKKTDKTVRNRQVEYEIWQKSFDAGRVGLGINGFENYRYHYFVCVSPQDKNEELELSNFFPGEQYVGTMEDGAFTYHDWSELVLTDVPAELKGQKLLTTIRGRGVETHLVNAFRKTDHPSSNQPDHALLTWSSDPSTSIDIQWRTDTTVPAGIVKYREKGSDQVYTEDASVYVMEDLRLMNDRFMHRFTARLKDLNPGTSYEYLIVPQTSWLKTQTFTTAGDNDSFSFIWFGDVHNSPKAGELHYMAEENHPETAFYAISGDLVGDGLYRNEWDELFEYSKDVISKKPLMTVPGNHDNRLGLGSKMFRDMLSYPTNGPDGVPEGQTYSFTYKNTLFLMLDSTSPSDTQTEWIDEQLTNTTATWKIAIFHFPPYNFNAPYYNIQEKWVPVFDKFHVDMVLGGHIHYYMRSKPMKAGEVVDSYNEGTAYIISIAIPARDRSIGEEPYAEVRYSDGQFYQHVNIDGDNLIYSAYDSENNLVDSFQIKKP